MLTRQSTACQSPHQSSSPPEYTSIRTATDATIELSVWINVRSKIYHYPARRWHGITVEGQFTTEGAARSAGCRAARNGQ